MFQQPARDALCLLLAASCQAPFQVGDLAIGIFGFGVAPKYQVHEEAPVISVWPVAHRAGRY